MVSLVLLWTLAGLTLAAIGYGIAKWAAAPGPALPSPARPPDLITLAEAVRQLAICLSSPDSSLPIEQAQSTLADAWARLPDPLRERLMARGIPENRVAELIQAPRPSDGAQRRRLLELAEALIADLDLT